MSVQVEQEPHPAALLETAHQAFDSEHLRKELLLLRVEVAIEILAKQPRAMVAKVDSVGVHHRDHHKDELLEQL